MTDTELMRLAAKAAGHVLAGEWWTPLSGVLIVSNGVPQLWEPLDEDGDALRLAVQLGLDLKLAQFLPEAFNLVPGVTPSHADAFEKARRAIVTAAAEIGKNMPA